MPGAPGLGLACTQLAEGSPQPGVRSRARDGLRAAGRSTAWQAPGVAGPLAARRLLAARRALQEGGAPSLGPACVHTPGTGLGLTVAVPAAPGRSPPACRPVPAGSPGWAQNRGLGFGGVPGTKGDNLLLSRVRCPFPEGLAPGSAGRPTGGVKELWGRCQLQMPWAAPQYHRELTGGESQAGGAGPVCGGGLLLLEEDGSVGWATGPAGVAHCRAGTVGRGPFTALLGQCTHRVCRTSTNKAEIGRAHV